MNGRITSVGVIDYTAVWKNDKLYLYVQSRLVAEREIAELTGAIFVCDFLYYTVKNSNVIFVESINGGGSVSTVLSEFTEVTVYKMLSDRDFIIQAVDENGKKATYIYDIESKGVKLVLPSDSFHDFAYDGENAFRISGHFIKDISVYKGDGDTLDVLYGEYAIQPDGEILLKCHFGVTEIDNGDDYVTQPNSKNIVFSLFDNYLVEYFYPRILTASYTVAMCCQLYGFIVFEKNTGAVKLLISLPKDIYNKIELYGFNEQSSVLTIWGDGEIHRYKIIPKNQKAIDELQSRYMEAYEAKKGSLRKNFEFDRLFFKAVDACEVNDINYYEESDSVTIVSDENGNEMQLEFLDIVDYGSDKYMVCNTIAVDEKRNRNFIILKINPSDENCTYSTVDDDETFKTVFQIFKDSH